MNNAKSGIGLVEVLASMFILALMFTAVNIMQSSNYDTSVRIQSRNEAQQIAQNQMASLEALGVNAVYSKDTVILGSPYKIAGGQQIQRRYTVERVVTENGVRDTVVGHDSLTSFHVQSKRVDLKVKWQQGTKWFDIVLSTVVQ